MNWYFEKDGVSQGPVAEAEMEQRVRSRDLSPQDLAWHVGLESWDTIEAIRPEWGKSLSQPLNPTPPAPEPMPEEAAAPEIKTRRETPVRAATPAPSRLKPQAPTNTKTGKLPKKAEPAEAPSTAEAEPESKPGLLKRLFGGGKKKK